MYQILNFRRGLLCSNNGLQSIHLSGMVRWSDIKRWEFSLCGARGGLVIRILISHGAWHESEKCCSALMVVLAGPCLVLYSLIGGDSEAHEPAVDDGFQSAPGEGGEPSPAVERDSGGELENLPLAQDLDNSEGQLVPGRTAASFLGTYRNGNEVASRMREVGLDPDQLPAPLETEAEARDSMASELQVDDQEIDGLLGCYSSWPSTGTIDQEWVLSELGSQKICSECELALASARAADLQSALEFKVAAYTTRLRDSVRVAVRNGNFELYPCVRLADSDDELQSGVPEKGGAFYSTGSALSSGWGGGLRLFREDYPQTAAALQDMDACRVARNLLISKILNSDG